MVQRADPGVSVKKPSGQGTGKAEPEGQWKPFGQTSPCSNLAGLEVTDPFVQ